MILVTTDAIDVWNWNITGTSAAPVHTLTSSIFPPPIRITNDPNPKSLSGVSHPPVIRTITPPPYPWTTSTGTGPFPPVSFTVGPPEPLCTSGGCGRKCHIFCDKPCRICPDGSSGFFGPSDPDPPQKPGCRGPGCVNGKCKGSLCIQVGCKGDDYHKGIYVGPDCHPTACSGPDCEPDSHCSGPDCVTAGCVGPGCGGDGLCFGLGCLSFGCIGPMCGTDHVCFGPQCTIITCTGPNCQYGRCIGKGCNPGGEEETCRADRARDCTEYVKSSLVRQASTMTTTTSTDCMTITACSAEPTTTTTTISSDGPVVTQTEAAFDAPQNNPAQRSAWQSSLLSLFSVWDAQRMTTTTSTSTTTTKSTKTHPTTTATPTPSEVRYDCDGSIICSSFIGLRDFCDVAKGQLVEDRLYGCVYPGLHLQRHNLANTLSGPGTETGRPERATRTACMHLLGAVCLWKAKTAR